MKKLLWGGLVAAFLFCGSAFAADCARTSGPYADGDILYAAAYDGEQNNQITCINARAQDTGDTLTGNFVYNSGGTLKFFSDVATTLKAEINYTTGKILGYLLSQGTYNINLVSSTTTDANDSITVQCGGAACSATNPGIVVMPGTTAGSLTGFFVTADVKQLISGTLWIQDAGNVTGVLIRAMFVNDNGTLRTCYAYVGGRDGGTVLTTDTNATQASVNLPEEVLCNTAVGSATNTVLEFGYVRANFTDATNVWANQTGVGDIVTGSTADGLYQPWNIDWSGFSSKPSAITARWTQHGRNVTLIYSQNASGTSDAVTTVFSSPVKSRQLQRPFLSMIKDNGGTIIAGAIETRVGQTSVDVYSTFANGAWTASGSKGVYGFNITFEVGPAASFIE